MTKYSPIESEFASSEDEAAYDAWFRVKVQRALESTRPTIAHDEAMARVRKVIPGALKRWTTSKRSPVTLRDVTQQRRIALSR